MIFSVINAPATRRRVVSCCYLDRTLARPRYGLHRRSPRDAQTAFAPGLLTLALLCVPALAPSAHASPQAQQPLLASVEAPTTLAQWVDYALLNNPRIAGARADYQAALARIPQASALPDPRLSLRYFFEPVETRVGPQQYAVGFSQPLPWLGKLRLQGEMASREAEAEATRISIIQNTIIAEVANAWYELYYADRSVDIVQGNRDLLAHLERVARARYRSGASSHPDVIRAQLELGKIENELASLVDRQRPLLARFNAALNRASGAPVATPTEAPVQRFSLEDAEVLERVVANNPRLLAQSLDLAAANSARERADAEHYPDFALGIDYIATDDAISPNVPDSGQDAVSAALTVTLPLQRGRYRAGVRAAEARIAGVQAQRDELLNELRASTAQTLFRLRDAERQVDLYATTLLPKANESMLATQRAYSAGSASFTELMDTQRMLLVFELAAARAVTDHNLARTALEELLGSALAAPASQSTTQENDNES